MADFVKISDKDTLYKAVDDARLKVEIGGSTFYFAPSVNMSYHLESGSEKYFINICDDEEQVKTDKAVEVVEKDLISVKVGDVESTFKSSDDNLKIERIFYTKPTEAPRYKLAFSKGISFYYQPELTQAEIDEGCFRPDNVVGSYAIYCDKSNHVKDKNGNTLVNYRTGKIGHLYAPYWTDAVGKKIKGTQEIKDGILTFALPAQKWLDSAILPLKLDPDLGYTGQGGTDYGSNNYVRGNVGTMPCDGTLTGIKMYISNLSGTASENHVKLGCFNSSSGPTGTAVDSGESDEITEIGAGKGISASGNLSNGSEYFFGFISKTSTVRGTFDNGITGQTAYYKASTTYASEFTDPAGSYLATSERRWGIYIEYTESGGGSTILPIIMHHLTKNIGT